MVFVVAMGRKKQPKTVVRLSPSKPEARDEGPRLLPLDTPHQPRHFEPLDHYLDLADKLLRPKTKQDKGQK
jgi:hypothetical protein